MANEKILQMPSGFPIQPTDAIPIARTGIPNGSNFSVAASQLVAIAPGPHDIQIGGNTSGTTANISTGTLFLAGGPNITLSQIGNAVTISGGAGGGGENFSAGLSNIGNTSGVTGLTGTQLVLAGGNNVTLSQSNDTAGATITVSAGAGFSAGISGGNSAGGGNSGLTGTQLLLAGGANVTLSQVNGLNGATISISASQPSVNLTIGGNTTSAGGGAPLISSGTMFLAGGANVTLSQNGQSVTISAGTAAAASLSISAGTTSSGYGGITFANGSGVSFGLNNGTITASVSQSVQTQAAGNIAGTNTAITGLASITLNTSGMSFNGVALAGTNLSLTTTAGSSLTATLNSSGLTLAMPAWLTTQSVQTQNVVDVTLGGNTSGVLALVSSGTLFLAGGNNVTLSQNGNSVTISANTVAAASLSVSAGTTTGAVGGLTFSNSNNISWGLNNGTITATVSQSNQTLPAGAIAGTGFTSATTAGTALVGTLNTAGLSVGVPVPVTSQTLQTQSILRAASLSGNTAGVLTIITSGTIYLAGGPNITLSQNGQSVSVSAAPPGGFQGGISNIGNTLGTSGITGTQLVLAGGNNVTLSQATGANGATVTVSAFNQSAQSLGVYASSQTLGQSSSSTIDARSLSFVGQGNISVGLSGASVLISGAGGAALGIYASSQTTGQSSSSTVNGQSLSIVAAGILSIGLSQGSLIISAPGSTGISQSVYATGNTTQSSSGTASIGSLLVQGAGGVSVGMSNGSLVISGGAGGGGGGGIFAGVSNIGNTAGSTGTVSTGNVVFVGSGPISLSQSTGAAGSAATITINGPIVSTLTGAGGITLSTAAGVITISAPAVSSLVGQGGISISTAGSTVSVYGNPVTRMIWPQAPQLTGISAFGNGSISVQYVAPMWPVTASRIDALVSWSASSTNSAVTAAIAMSAYCAIFTRNGSTLSSLSSGSTQTTYTYASNSAGHTEFITAAIRPVSVPVNVSMTPGEYFVAFNLSTNSSSVGAATTNLAQSISMMGGNDLQTAANYAEIGSQTATSTNWFGGMGVYTAASAGIGASLALSNIAQTGTSLSQANIALVFRNA